MQGSACEWHRRPAAVSRQFWWGAAVCIPCPGDHLPHVPWTGEYIHSIVIHCTYGCGSVLLWQGDEIPRGRDSFGGFLPHWQCMMLFGMMSGLSPSNSVLHGGDNPQRGRGIFSTSLTPGWIANWTGPCSSMHMIGADAWLQALDESIRGREGGWGCTLRVTSDVYDCLVLYLDYCHIVPLVFIAAFLCGVTVKNRVMAAAVFYAGTVSNSLCMHVSFFPLIDSIIAMIIIIISIFI